jgi:predicted RND superfamily exporter protein
MARITIAIYRFFKQYPAVFYLVLLLSTAFFAYFGLQMKYEEDISKLLPSNNIGSSEQLVFNNLKVKDKIFVVMQNQDSTVLDTDRLIAAMDQFSENLLTNDTDSNVQSLLYQVEEEWMLNGVEYLYSHLPLYLDSTDYVAFDSIFSPKNIAAQMESNFDDLQSASGMFTYEIIQRDPAGLRYALKNKASSLIGAIGGSYKIIDNHFFTPDSTTIIAFLSPNFIGFDSKTGTQLVKQMEREIAQLKSDFPEVEVYFHGAPIQSVFNSRQIKSDLIMTIGVSLLLACCFIWACFKGKATILWLLLPIGYGMLFALCTLYFMQGMMSLMAVGIGAIVLGVALSYCLHVITHYKYVSNPEKVLMEQTKPVILGSITTIGAFMGLTFTDSSLLKDFGLFASFALIGTTLFCLLFLPQFFKAKNNSYSEKAFRTLDKINSFPFEKQRWLVVSLVIITAICCYTSPWVTFDTDLKNIGYNNPRVVKSGKILADKTTHGYKSTYFAVMSPSINTALVYHAQFMEHLDSLQAQGLIKSYSNTSVLNPTLAVQQQRIAWWQSYFTPNKVAQIKANLLKYAEPYGFTADVFEPFFNLIEQTPQTANLLTAGILPDALLCNYLEHTDGNYLLFTPVLSEQENYYNTYSQVLKSNGSVVIDPFYYTQDMVRILNNDFNVILGISSVFVLFILLISFKSLTLALIAFMPMTLSWYIIQGVMGIFGLQFNLINIIVSSFIFGCGVDYSIFILDGLLGETREKGRLLMQHKTAIFLSAVVLIVSISSLIFATHPAMASIGLITLIGMTATMLLAYTLEPFLFHLMYRFAFFQKIVAKRNTTFKPDKQGL